MNAKDTPIAHVENLENSQEFFHREKILLGDRFKIEYRCIGERFVIFKLRNCIQIGNQKSRGPFIHQ